MFPGEIQEAMATEVSLSNRDALRYRKLREQLMGACGEKIDGAQVWRAGTALDEYADSLPNPPLMEGKET